jgi:peptidyl-prolyl cis-trans isomerase B (cyclophilin B)
MLRLPAVVLVLACALLVAACGGDDDSGDGAAANATPTAAAPAGCEAAEAPEPKGEGNLPKPKAKLAAGKTYVATVSTNCGDFQITLDPKRAPKTGGSFKSLADKGFFDGTTFHRVVDGFVIQGGDPKGDGTGGPGYSVVEAPPKNLAYSKGVVAMAKTGNEPAGTSGSQFFVVTAEDAGLPPDYAVVGRVTEGMDTVEKIEALGDQTTEQPSQTVVVTGVDVESA